MCLADCGTVGIYENLFSDIQNNEDRSWNTVRQHLDCPFGLGSMSAPTPTPPWGSNVKDERSWLAWATTHHSDPTEMVVWVCEHVNGPFAKLPYEGKGVHTDWLTGHAWPGNYDREASPAHLAHELGHALGLPHPFGIIAMLSDPFGDAIDPSTGAKFEYSDFWDLMFYPSLSPTDPPDFFNSRNEAYAYRAHLKEINRRPGDVDNCTILDGYGTSYSSRVFRTSGGRSRRSTCFSRVRAGTLRACGCSRPRSWAMPLARRRRPAHQPFPSAG